MIKNPISVPNLIASTPVVYKIVESPKPRPKPINPAIENLNSFNLIFSNL